MEQLSKIVSEMDEDGSGEIEFEEFLALLKGPSKAYSNAGDTHRNVHNTLKQIMNGTHKITNGDEETPLSITLQNLQRTIILSNISWIKK